MPHAIVLGAGIAGLASGIALRRAGWSVEIVERAPALAPLGAGLGLWANGMAALRQLGAAAPLERSAAPIRSLRLASAADRTLLAHPVVDARLVTRAALQSALLTAALGIPLTLGTEAVALDPDAGTVDFAAGPSRRADLIVVADGIRSAAARDLLGLRPHYRGYTGVVALSDPVGIDGHEGVAAEYWGRGDRFGLFDLGGGRRYWFYMATGPADAALPDLTALARGYPAAIARAVAATPPDRLIRWPIHAARAPARLAVGRALFVGDAAHPMEPNLGQGACQALEDAVALEAAAVDARALAVPPAFEALRLARVRTLVARSAEGGRAIHGPAPVRAVMQGAMRIVPAAIAARAMTDHHRLPDYGQR